MMSFKTLAKKVVPKPVRNAVKYIVSSDYRDRLCWERDRQVGQRVFAVTGGVVVAGPFKGLQYVSTARGSCIGPKLLGTYELELRDVVEQAVARAYGTVINIGAGEGYYAVGLAKRMPHAKLIAFDADPSNQEQIKTLARLNGVQDRLDVRGFCDDTALSAALASATGQVLIVCDIEGAEVEVLRPDAVPALRNVDLLVEMHDIIRKGCSEALRDRFGATHDIDVIPTRRRTAADFPPGVEVPAGERRNTCMEEGRGAVMTFFWMRAKSSS